MADVIKKIRTPDGDLPIDYNALANKPDLDEKLNTSGGTVTGDLTIEGDLRVQGDAVETHLENVKIPQNSLTLRDGASQGLLNNEYTGIVAEKYDGANDGMLVFDKGGTAYVGDEGDLQPLATRGNVVNNNLVKWDQQNLTLVDAGESVDSIGQKIDAKAHLSHTTKQENVGYSIDVSSDSANYAEVTKVGGMTRKCTNLIPFPYFENTKTINGLTFTINIDGSIQVVGTATANTAFYLVGETSAQRKPIQAGTYTTSATGDSKIEFIIGIAGDKEYNASYYGSKVTITVGSDTTYYAKLRILSGVTVNSTVYPMLNAGSTALPYEPYFEGLRSAKVTEVKSIGANLFDEQWKAGYYISSAGVDIASSLNICSANITPVKPNTQYTFTVNANVTINTRAVAFYIDGVFHSRIQSGFSFTTPNGVNGVRLGMDNSDGKAFTASLIESAILNAGSTALPYSPYMENILTIPAAVQALDGWGQGIDATYNNHIAWSEDGTEKTYNKMVDDFTLDGSSDENLTLNNDYSGALYNCFVINLGSGKWLKSASVGVCNQCEITTSATILEEDAPYAYFGNVSIGQFFFKLPKATVPDVATLRTYLASNPVIAFYIATPEVTDISDLITADNMLSVEGGGTLTFENEYRYVVPSEVVFYEEPNDVVGANTFVGDLVGTAARATADKNGNNITETYATKIEMNEKLDVSAKKIYSGIKHQEDVPADSANYAAVQKVGGMTRKCENLCSPLVNAVDNPYVLRTAHISVKANTDYAIRVLANPNIQNIYVVAPDNTILALNTGVVGEIVSTFNTGNYTELFLQINTIDAAGDASNYKAMLNEGSTALPYESYYEGLRSAKVTEVKSIGTNLLPIADKTLTVKGCTVSSNNGNITITGTANANGGRLVPISTVTLEAGTYCFSGGFEVYLSNKADESAITTGNNRPFTLDKKTTLILGHNFQQGVTYSKTFNAWITKGSTALPYAPYVENTLAIPEAVQALDGYGLGVNENCYNYIAWNLEDNIKTWNKKCGVVDLGTETFTIGGTTYSYTPRSYKPNASVICDLPSPFKEIYVDTYGAIVVFYENGSFTSAAEIKAAMAGVMLVYELAEPIVTDISDLIGDNSIGVQSNGTLTFENEYGYAVPSEVAFYNEKAEIVAADKIIGNLTGVSTRAISDENGRNIADTFDARKKSGRLVIGIAGTHTLDDADILFGASESDASANSTMLNEAISKGGFGELFFLEGTFYVNNFIKARGIYGVSPMVSTLCCPSSYNRTILYNVLVTKNIHLINSATSTGIYLEQQIDSVTYDKDIDQILIDNVWFTNGYGVYITDLNDTIRRSRFSNCTTAIEHYDKGTTIAQMCEFLSCQSVATIDGTMGIVSGAINLIDNSFTDSLIESSVTNCFTTIGATKLTEEKVKALNAVGTKVVYEKKMSLSSFYSHLSGTFKRGNDTLYAVIAKGATTNFVSTGIMQASSEKSKTTAYLDIGTVKVDFDEDKVFINGDTHAEVEEITFIRIL